MTVVPGFPAVSLAATFFDIRKALASDVIRDASGAIRSGIYPAHLNALVTSTATMNVAVAPFVAGIDRNGLVRVANDGSVNVAITAAPGAGSRWSVVYVKQRESAAPISDGADGPVLDKVESTTSEAAARALLPAGALELAVVQVPAGATATNSGGVIITQTFRYTSAPGSVVHLRNSTEQTAWTPADGAVAFRIDTLTYMDRTGGAWTSRNKRIRRVAGTASGSLATGSGWVNLAAQQTIPAAPFGTGVPYSVRVFAVSNATLSANFYAIRVQIDAATDSTQQVGGTGSFSVSTETRQTISSPNSTHTVDVQIFSVTGTSTIATGATVSYFIIELERADSF